MLLDYCLGRMREAALDAAHLTRSTPNAGPLDVPRWVKLLTSAAGLESGGDPRGARVESATATVICATLGQFL